MSKTRLDVLLCDKGLVESREKAKATIMAGLVFVNGQRIDKPGTAIPDDSSIEVRGGTMPFVSRGGLKLEKALKVFDVDPAEKVCIDCGASTGGFTDCLLKAGAAKVYAVDVGYGQLAWSIRNDPKVISLERTNIRYVTHEQIPEELDLAVIDVSFISLRLVLPVVYELLKSDGEAISLIKPQFEAGKDNVGKKGVVRDKSVHLQVLDSFVDSAERIGFIVTNMSFSPVKGPEGNIEYLAHLSKKKFDVARPDLKTIVELSHSELGE